MRVPADAEVVVTDTLRADAAVAAIVDDRVYTAIPPNPAYPLLLARRFGGRLRTRNHIDSVRIQLDAHAETKADARLLVATAQKALHDAEGTVHDLAVIGAVDTVSGPTWLPDQPTDLPRYTVDLQVDLRPIAGNGES